MAKQIIRLTESDLHRIIKNTVNRIMTEEEHGDWRDSYNKWSDGDYKDEEEGRKLNSKWTKELKTKYPDKNDRRIAISKHMKRRDVGKGKTDDKPYWRNYEKDMED